MTLGIPDTTIPPANEWVFCAMVEQMGIRWTVSLVMNGSISNLGRRMLPVWVGRDALGTVTYGTEVEALLIAERIQTTYRERTGARVWVTREPGAMGRWMRWEKAAKEQRERSEG